MLIKVKHHTNNHEFITYLVVMMYQKQFYERFMEYIREEALIFDRKRRISKNVANRLIRSFEKVELLVVYRCSVL